MISIARIYHQYTRESTRLALERGAWNAAMVVGLFPSVSSSTVSSSSSPSLLSSVPQLPTTTPASRPVQVQTQKQMQQKDTKKHIHPCRVPHPAEQNYDYTGKNTILRDDYHHHHRRDATTLVGRRCAPRRGAGKEGGMQEQQQQQQQQQPQSPHYHPPSAPVPQCMLRPTYSCAAMSCTPEIVFTNNSTFNSNNSSPSFPIYPPAPMALLL